MRFILFLFLQVCLFATDFDCVIVGTSPFSLFEALYQFHSGKRVLILEEAPSCGGAWKTIDICGIPHADLGCHQIGHDMQLKAFLEEYAGCKIVSMDHPLLPFDPAKSPNGWYFSQGCFELIDHLLKLVATTDIVLLTNRKVETVSVDPMQKIATVVTKERAFTTSQLIVTPMSCISNPYGKLKYCHLYLLIQDPTPPRFSYHYGVGSGVSRLMNLTHFVGLSNTGRQLIVVQVHSDQYLANGQMILDALKSQKLVDPSAYILKAEPYVYESGSFYQSSIAQMGAQGIIEMLQTGHIQNLSNYISKWQKALKPYQVALQNRN